MVNFVVLKTSLFLCFTAVIASDNILNNLLNNRDLEFIDLSYSFDKDTIHWPTVRNFEFTKKNENFQSDGSWYAENEFTSSEHGGTHIDAPYHFAADGRKVDEILIENLVVPLIIADVSSMANDDSNFVLYKNHLDYVINDNLGKPFLIIFKFGWSKFASDRNKYFGFNKNNTLNFPGLSPEVVEWITTSYKNVVGIGVDVASVDPGSSTDFKAHKIIARSGIYILENVKLDKPVPDNKQADCSPDGNRQPSLIDIEDVNEYGCTAIAMPMKIANGSGAPVRLVAMCPKKLPTHF